MIRSQHYVFAPALLLLLKLSIYPTQQLSFIYLPLCTCEASYFMFSCCPSFITVDFIYMLSFDFRLGKILEVDEVVKALMEGILTNQKMVFVPSNQRFALLLERYVTT